MDNDTDKFLMGFFAIAAVLIIGSGSCGGGGPCSGQPQAEQRACHELYRDADRNGGLFLP